MNTATLLSLDALFSKREVRLVRQHAAEAQVLEYTWVQKLEHLYEALIREIFEHIQANGELPESLPDVFTLFYVEHSFHAMQKGFEVAGAMTEQAQTPPERRLAVASGRVRVPRSLRELMILWDHFRKKKQVPPRQKKLAEKVRSAYLKKVQQVWKENAGKFRNGTVADQYEVREALRQAADTTFSRAKMIVETETTYFYNQARKEVYDQSPDVTHYLFVAIRDAATTAWCKTRNGVVYTKGTVVFEQEVPPCHWNCRSEILPLTPQNPRHLALINSTHMLRQNRHPAPLPPGWGKR